MTGWEKQEELAQYRVRQAEESLDEARFLLAGGKSARSVINRACYTCSMRYWRCSSYESLKFRPFAQPRSRRKLAKRPRDSPGFPPVK